MAHKAARKGEKISDEKNQKVLTYYILCFTQRLEIYGRVEEHKQHIPDVVDNLIATLYE